MARPTGLDLLSTKEGLVEVPITSRTTTTKFSNRIDPHGLRDP